MPSTILHKRTQTPGASPTPVVLSGGELAMNVADGKLFIKSVNNVIKTFSNDEYQAYALNTTLSAVNFRYGGNTVSQIFASVLGGYNNDISGAGSTVVNGENNDIAADFAFIGNGIDNLITLAGDYGAILGGRNNTLSHQDSFIIGSNLTSGLSGFTYVNNLSAQGGVYGDGSNLTGVVSEVARARVYNADTTTLVRGNVVYSFGAHGDIMSVKLASNTSETTSSKTLGFVNETIAPGGTGYVTIAGQLTNLSIGSLTPGDAVWLGSTAGSFTTTKPIAPNHTVYLGVVERANPGNGMIYVKVQNGYELNEIHDVLIASVSAGDVVRRNSSNTLWQNTKDGLKWDSVYTTVSANSASWGTGGSAQTLSFNEVTKDLSISPGGNTVSLSAFGSGSDYEVRALSGSWQNVYTEYSANSASYATNSTVNSVSSQLVLNTDFNSYKTSVASATATLLPTTVYQSASGNWQSVYNIVQTNSASNWDNSLVTSYVNSTFLPIAGGTLTGNLSVLGDLVYVDTSVAVVSTMYIDTNTVLDPALRITQRGTGDVIRIEDSANPDSTPFIINSDGLVGIGTSSPNEELTVIGNVSATGSYYGDGSNLTGIVAGDTVATTLVRSNSGFWQDTYTTVSSLSSNWQTTFQASSAYVSSNPTGITGASALTKLLQITQAGYNAITPASDTLYIIVG